VKEYRNFTESHQHVVLVLPSSKGCAKMSDTQHILQGWMHQITPKRGYLTNTH